MNNKSAKLFLNRNYIICIYVTSNRPLPYFLIENALGLTLENQKSVIPICARPTDKG